MISDWPNQITFIRQIEHGNAIDFRESYGGGRSGSFKPGLNHVTLIADMFEIS